MKILLISDIHLSHKFDYRKYLYLKNIISEVDKVILNGDFWDKDKTKFETFVSSDWAKLFSLLKSKNTIYVLGNHDKNTPNEAKKIFCDEITDNYKLVINDTVFFITHGHNVVRYVNNFHSFVEKRNILKKIIERIHGLVDKLINKQIRKLLYGRMNNEMKEWRNKNFQNDTILVCGHSHLQEFDMKNKFINLGGNIYNLKQYVLIEDNIIKVVNNGRVEVEHII
jgi:predicted phosphodiesterase